MSIESAKAFYDRMVTDKAFRTQHQDAASDDERREIVLAAGYRFTPEEWKIATTQIQASNSDEGELSDAQLETVSGGMPMVFPMYGGPLLDPPIFPLNDPLSGPFQPK